MRGDNRGVLYSRPVQLVVVIPPFFVVAVYPLTAWIGVMLLGFGSASIFTLEPARRDRQLMIIGALCIAAFFLLRASGLYGDPNGWSAGANMIDTARDFMNVTKYPPSLLYLLITLGPMAIVCALADRFDGWLKETLVMFGRVPFAFYILHLYLIHALAVFAGVLQGFDTGEMLVPFFLLPEGYGISLAAVYLVWLLVIALLYPVCNWFAELKSRRRDWWLSYL